jgi:hypothetical protein
MTRTQHRRQAGRQAGDRRMYIDTKRATLPLAIKQADPSPRVTELTMITYMTYMGEQTGGTSYSYPPSVIHHSI